MDFGKCFLTEGQIFDPTITTVGPINTPESLYLGQVYKVFVNGKKRRVRTVRNVTGSTLLPCQVCKYVTTAGRFRKDVTLATGDTDAPAGVVEDQYKAGVPDGMWFRMVEFAEEHNLIIQVTSDSRCTFANGAILVAAADDGTVMAQNSAASNAAVQNRVGYALIAMTNGVSNLVAGTKFLCEVNILGGGMD